MEEKKDLLEYRLEDVDFFYTGYVRSSFGLRRDDSIRKMVSTVLMYFEGNPSYQELIGINSIRRKLDDRKAILSAFGESDGGVWVCDLESRIPIQEWVDDKDGKYSVLILHCSNPGLHEVFSDKTPVLSYDSDYSLYLW